MEHPLIRSFGRRTAKSLSEKDKEILAQMTPLLSVPEASNFKNLFPNSIKKWALDIGFGGGENLIEKIMADPQTAWVGGEVFYKGIVSFIKHWEKANRPINVRVYTEDIRDLLKEVPAETFNQIDLFYPDPWPKKRHRKRRMINDYVILNRTLKTNGVLRLVSDIPDYIDHARDVFVLKNGWKIESDSEIPFENWMTTRYEQKALRENRTPQYLSIVKK